MPNPECIAAGGHPIYHSFLDVFSDDVSGNHTKSWNKHLNIYITHQNLPQKLLNQEFHMHFISTSLNASISEQFHNFKKVLEYIFPLFHFFCCKFTNLYTADQLMTIWYMFMMHTQGKKFKSSFIRMLAPQIIQWQMILQAISEAMGTSFAENAMSGEPWRKKKLMLAITVYLQCEHHHPHWDALLISFF